MLIRTLNRTLHVLQVVEKTEAISVYVCTDIMEQEQSLYLLNGFLQDDSYSALMPLFLRQERNSHFSDYVESFSLDGIFYLLFRCQKGRPLLDRIEKVSLEQRLEYGRMLIEYMVLQDMDLVVQCAVLRPECLILTEENTVQFFYNLSELTAGEPPAFHDAELACLEILKRLFAEELEMQYSQELLSFCRALMDGEQYHSYAELYAAYGGVYDDLKSRMNRLVSGKYRFKLWEKIKKNFTKIRNVLFLLLGAAAVIVLLYQLFFSEKETEETVDSMKVIS